MCFVSSISFLSGLERQMYLPRIAREQSLVLLSLFILMEYPFECFNLSLNLFFCTVSCTAAERILVHSVDFSKIFS